MRAKGLSTRLYKETQNSALFDSLFLQTQTDLNWKHFQKQLMKNVYLRYPR